MERIVIVGLEDMTAQQVFDMAANHVLTTREKSLDSRNLCVYGGVGCAASPFIKPEFRDKVEGSWPYLRFIGQDEREICRYDLTPEAHGELILGIQSCHDQVSSEKDKFVDEFKKRMRRVAEICALSTHVIDQDDKAHGQVS